MSQLVGVVLAAGFGTRLRPSTDHYPKPLIPVAGIEPLFYALERFERLGIYRVVVNAHYKNEDILFRLKSWAPLLPKLQIRASLEMPEILGSGGAIIKIIKDHWDWCQGSGLVVQNGDTIGGISLSELYHNLEVSTFAVSKFQSHLKNYNPLWLHSNGNWEGIGKTAPSQSSVPAHFLGAYYLRPSVLKKIYSNVFNVANVDLFNGVWRPVEQQGEIFKSLEFKFRSDQLEPFWFDMTTQQHLLDAQQHLMEVLRQPLSATLWGQCLQQRYPGLKEVHSACWSNWSDPSALQWAQGPALFFSESRPLQNYKMHSNSCFIDENIQSTTRASTEWVEVLNSVVLIRPQLKLRKSHEGQTASELVARMPKKIEDTICIF